MHQIQEFQDNKSIFGSIYEFLIYCIKQYYFTYQAEITSTPRLKLYFAKREKVNQFREFLLQKDLEIKDYDVNWKKKDSTFIENLPEL